LSTGKDGLLFAYHLQPEALTLEAKEEIPPITMKFPEEKDGVDKIAFSEQITINGEINVDILDDSVYSIQQAKLRTEEDHRMRMAELKKQRVRKDIIQIRDEFNAILKKNMDQKEELRMEDDELNVDPHYFDMLEKEMEQCVFETKRELAYDEEWHQVSLDKLKGKFLDVLDYDLVMVKAIKTPYFLRSFRLGKKSSTLEINLKKYKQAEIVEARRKSLADEQLDLLEYENFAPFQFINFLERKAEEKKKNPNRKSRYLNSNKQKMAVKADSFSIFVSGVKNNATDIRDSRSQEINKSKEQRKTKNGKRGKKKQNRGT
jgi:hypothetical protein